MNLTDKINEKWQELDKQKKAKQIAVEAGKLLRPIIVGGLLFKQQAKIIQENTKATNELAKTIDKFLGGPGSFI